MQRSIVTVMFLVGLLGSSARADVVEILASKDNTLYEDETGSLSNGTGTGLFAGRTGGGSIRRGLIAFDVASAVPAGAVVTAATLKLVVTQTNAGPVPVSLHLAAASWGEGASNAPGNGGGGAAAADGDATWIHRFYPVDPWDSPGGDYAPSPSATQTVDGVGEYVWSSETMLDDVRDWVDEADSNFGWFVVGSEDTAQTSKRFHSREAENPGVQPRLTIEFETSTGVPATSTLAVWVLALALLGLGTLALRRRAMGTRDNPSPGG